MLTCKDLTEIVTEYVEGRMGFGQQLKFQLHLGMCRHCRRYVRQMRHTIALSQLLPSPPVPDELRDELLRRFRDWKA